MWIIDVNRQSLDRVVPGIRIAQWKQQFPAAGWHVVEAKYGHRLQAAFARPGGESLRAWIDQMPNEHYQSLFGSPGAIALGTGFLMARRTMSAAFCAGLADDGELAGLVTDLAGHDFRSLLAAFDDCDREKDRPSVVFAYTVKGWGLPIAGNPRNHSALLSTAQIDELRARLGLTLATEWDRLDPMTTAGQWVAARREHLARAPRRQFGPAVTVPDSTGTAPRQADLHPGGARPDPRRPVPRRGGRALPGHHRARCRHLDQPGRLHQPHRRLQPGRAPLVERGRRAQVGRGPGRASTSSSASAR